MSVSEDGRAGIVITLERDFPYKDLLLVGRMLEQANVLVPGFTPSQFGIYQPDGYLFEKRLYDVDFYLLPDRNLVSRMARVAMGGPVDAPCRTAACLMAFAQCLNLNFEPSIAFHELAHRHGNEIAREELRWFRVADQARPLDWIAIATGRKKRIRSLPPVIDVGDLDLAKPLTRWNRNYVLALKIAELELTKSPAVKKALHLLDWMYSDFILGGPAFLFASLYFAPSAPRRRLLKQLRSQDRARALDGVRNAAWDLTHISDFIRRVREGSEQERFILASADKGLTNVAETLILCPDEPDAADVLTDGLSKWWPHDHARTIAAAYATCVEGIDDKNRHVNQPDPPAGYVSSLIARGEQLLSAWRP